MYPTDDILKKYLLKLWIKKRLEEIRKNSTSSQTLPTPTTTTNMCPETYTNDPESVLLCELWEELEGLKRGEAGEVGLQPGVSAFRVLCPYRDHATSSLILCQLWCEIQTFYNKVSYAD